MDDERKQTGACPSKTASNLRNLLWRTCQRDMEPFHLKKAACKPFRGSGDGKLLPKVARLRTYGARVAREDRCAAHGSVQRWELCVGEPAIEKIFSLSVTMFCLTAQHCCATLWITMLRKERTRWNKAAKTDRS